MAHKGYTLNYFIDFFKNIPDHRWTEGRLQEYGTVQKCALGHAASNLRAEADSEVDLDTVNSSERVTALQEFLNDKTANINDGVGPYGFLGATPRGRILRALRNRKRTGNVMGSEE